MLSAPDENQWTYHSLIAVRDNRFDMFRTTLHADLWIWRCKKYLPETTHHSILVRLVCGFWVQMVRMGPYIFVSDVAEPRQTFAYSCHLSIAAHYE